MNRNALLLGVGGLGVLTVVTLLAWSLSSSRQEGGACTREARVCADGTVVGRTGPQCEFAACPSDVRDLMPTSTPEDVIREERSADQPADTGTTMCTMDAKQCPDGSYVGRSGPNCEFVCPVTPSASLITVRGSVMVGPTCPIAKNPPDASCADTPYLGTILLTNTSTGESHSATTTSEGVFTMEIERGVYDISRPEGSSPFPVCRGKVEVLSPASMIPISCDSGIR